MYKLFIYYIDASRRYHRARDNHIIYTSTASSGPLVQEIRVLSVAAISCAVQTQTSDRKVYRCFRFLLPRDTVHVVFAELYNTYILYSIAGHSAARTAVYPIGLENLRES